jgi:hypothetical protein
MLKSDDKVFFRLPKEDTPKRRSLRPGVVVLVKDDACVIELDEAIDRIEEPVEAFLHFDRNLKFLQQAIRVENMSE